MSFFKHTYLVRGSEKRDTYYLVTQHAICYAFEEDLGKVILVKRRHLEKKVEDKLCFFQIHEGT